VIKNQKPIEETSLVLSFWKSDILLENGKDKVFFTPSSLPLSK